MAILGLCFAHPILQYIMRFSEELQPQGEKNSNPTHVWGEVKSKVLLPSPYLLCEHVCVCTLQLSILPWEIGCAIWRGTKASHPVL